MGEFVGFPWARIIFNIIPQVEFGNGGVESHCAGHGAEFFGEGPLAEVADGMLAMEYACSGKVANLGVAVSFFSASDRPQAKYYININNGDVVEKGHYYARAGC